MLYSFRLPIDVYENWYFFFRLNWSNVSFCIASHNLILEIVFHFHNFIRIHYENKEPKPSNRVSHSFIGLLDDKIWLFIRNQSISFDFVDWQINETETFSISRQNINHTNKNATQEQILFWRYKSAKNMYFNTKGAIVQVVQVVPFRICVFYYRWSYSCLYSVCIEGMKERKENETKWIIELSWAMGVFIHIEIIIQSNSPRIEQFELCHSSNWMEK